MSDTGEKTATLKEIEAIYGEIHKESFTLLQKAYEERRASVESLNTRSGIALALVGSAIIAANLEVWNFHRPLFTEGWSLWLLADLANFVSIFAFALGTILILRGLYAQTRKTPYNTYALNQLGNGTKEVDAFRDLPQFYRLQMAKTYQAYKELEKLTDIKAACFNRGITLVFASLALVVFSKLIT